MATDEDFLDMVPLPEGFKFVPDEKRSRPLQNIARCQQVLLNTKYQRSIAGDAARQLRNLIVDNLTVLFRVLMFYRGLLDKQPDFYTMVGQDWGIAGGEETFRLTEFYKACRTEYLKTTDGAQTRPEPANRHDLLCNLVDQWLEPRTQDEIDRPRIRGFLIGAIRGCLNSVVENKRSQLFNLNVTELPRIQYLKKRNRRLGSRCAAITKHRQIPAATEKDDDKGAQV